MSEYDRLWREINGLKKNVRGLSQPQLAFSTVEDGQVLYRDGDGNLRMVVGAQSDGTHAVVHVQGPPPPRPTTPIVSVDGPVVRVRWDGQLMGTHIPEDFARIDVHFALASDDLEEPAAVRANLATAAGSEATLMATQTGTYRVGLVAMSQSRARSEMSDTVEVEVQVVDLATAIESAAQSANGKNRVTYSSRSPEPSDEGIEGDTWWVNEVRPRDEGDPAAGLVVAIIEQWQHAGGVWVQVEMAHEVIASVDLGRATVGYLHGQRIEARTIDTEQLAFGAATGDILSADALNFKTATGLDIRSSSFRAGDSVEITSGYGIRQFGPDGELNVSLPSDGSEAKFRGDLSARTLTATGRMSIQGPGAVSSGGTLELESGVVPPVHAPQVKLEWDRTVLPELDDTEFASGLTFGDGHFWRVISTSTPLSEGGRVRVEKLSPSGALVDGWDTTFRVRVNGVTFLNGLLYILAGRLPAVYGSGKYVDRVVVAYNTAGVEQRRWEYPHYGTGMYQPGIGNDGTNIVIYQSGSDGDMTYRRYSPTTGALRSTHDMSGKMRSNCTGIAFGEFDYADGDKVIIAQERVDRMAFVCYDDSPGAEADIPRSWHAGNLEVPVGLAWDGSRFHSLDQAGNLVSYQSRSADHHNGDNADDWWIGNTWWDGVHGGSETTLGPATRFTWHHRAKVNIRFVDPPPGVGGWYLYIARHSSTPGDDLFHWVWRRQELDGDWSFTMPDVVSYWGGTEGPPASNTFPNATPGEIHSVLGNFRVDGTGAGEWGPLTFHQDGSMTGIPKFARGEVVVTPVAGTSTYMEVTLPAGLFTSPPTVLATLQTGNLASAQNVGVNYKKTTKDSFEVVLLRSNTVATLINWVAIGE